MASTTKTASVTFENTFEDGTTANLTINNVQTTGMTNTKALIKQFNNELPGSDFANRLVSKTGAKWKRISGCKVTTIERIYYF